MGNPQQKTVKNLKWLTFEKYNAEKAGNPSRASESKKRMKKVNIKSEYKIHIHFLSEYKLFLHLLYCVRVFLYQYLYLYLFLYLYLYQQKSSWLPAISVSHNRLSVAKRASEAQQGPEAKLKMSSTHHTNLSSHHTNLSSHNTNLFLFSVIVSSSSKPNKQSTRASSTKGRIDIYCYVAKYQVMDK